MILFNITKMIPYLTLLCFCHNHCHTPRKNIASLLMYHLNSSYVYSIYTGYFHYFLDKPNLHSNFESLENFKFHTIPVTVTVTKFHS